MMQAKEHLLRQSVNIMCTMSCAPPVPSALQTAQSDMMQAKEQLDQAKHEHEAAETSLRQHLQQTLTEAEEAMQTK